MTTKPLPKGKVLIEVIKGVSGLSLYVSNQDSGHRLAGPKPWGGGTTLHTFEVDAAELIREVTAYSMPEVDDAEEG